MSAGPCPGWPNATLTSPKNPDTPIKLFFSPMGQTTFVASKCHGEEWLKTPLAPADGDCRGFAAPLQGDWPVDTAIRPEPECCGCGVCGSRHLSSEGKRKGPCRMAWSLRFLREVFAVRDYSAGGRVPRPRPPPWPPRPPGPPGPPGPPKPPRPPIMARMSTSNFAPFIFSSCAF